MQVCSEHTGEGTIWPVDANLRPEGKAGPLVRTLASHRAYYERWAKTWEFQALLKARPVAGDLALGQEFVVAGRADGVAGRRARRVRRRRAGDAAAGAREHPGPRGRPSAQARRRAGCATSSSPSSSSSSCTGAPTSTCATPATLQRAGRPDRAAGTSAARTARRCTAAYEFLRTLEHRIQLQHLRRTHVVPADDASLRRLGRGMGFTKEPAQGAGGGVGAPPPGGTPPPREALLPAAARGRGAGAGRGRAAHHRGGRRAARRARVRRPAGRAAPPRGADQRR